MCCKDMLNFTDSTQVYLACGSTDLRKSFEGLTVIVKLDFELDPYSKAMYVFCNRSRSLIKILQWDGTGFWLYIKRLHKGQFRWPESSSEAKQISTKQLKWLLDGLSLEQKTAFKEHHPTVLF